MSGINDDPGQASSSSAEPNHSPVDREMRDGEPATTSPPAGVQSGQASSAETDSGAKVGDAPIDPFDEQLVNEIRILVDFLSANSTRSLASGSAGRLPTADPAKGLSSGTHTYGDALQRYFEIARKPLGTDPSSTLPALSAAERRFLSEFRDYLTEAARPATASTIAFSTLVSEFEKSRGGDIGEGAGLFRSIRLSFPRYQELARNFRQLIGTFRWLSLALLLFIFLASAYVYSASLYLDRLAASQAREAAIDEKLAKAELTLDDQLPGPQQALVADLATKSLPNSRVASDAPRLRQCVLYTKKGPSDNPILERHYSSQGLWKLETNGNGPDLSGRPTGPNDLYPDADFLFYTDVSYFRLCNELGVAKGDTRAEQEQLKAWVRPVQLLFQTSKSVELNGANVIAIVNGYLLPLLMGIVGSLVFVLRTYLTQLRERTLDPRDKHIYLIRLLLGSIAGLAIGFFMHPELATSTAASTNPWNATISLTTPALAFLAGYAVEIVFALLELARTSAVRRAEVMGSKSVPLSISNDWTPSVIGRW